MFKKILLTPSLLLATTLPAAAQSLGIDFSSMKKGTKFFYESSDGEHYIEVYKGKRRDGHELARYKGKTSLGQRIGSWFFDDAGRLTQIKFGQGTGRFTYTPFHCAYVAGKCSHDYLFTGTGYVLGGEGWTLKSNIKREGSGYLVQFQRVNGDDATGQYAFELGQYNMRSMLMFPGNGDVEVIRLTKIQ